MGTEAEEAAAIEALDGAEWMGRNLKVNDRGLLISEVCTNSGQTKKSALTEG